MSEVVTGDAVVLDVRVAQLPIRALSALIDITVIPGIDIPRPLRPRTVFPAVRA